MESNQNHKGGKRGVAIFYILLAIVISYMTAAVSELAKIGSAGAGSGASDSVLTTVSGLFMYGLSVVLLVSGLMIFYLTSKNQSDAVEKEIDRAFLYPFYAFLLGVLFLGLVSMA